jgi:transaldolase/glucose-6-phosphate isomerase
VKALESVSEYGQSIWLDVISRSLVTSGELARLIEEDGVRGVTSNPSIFEKSIAGSDDYEGLLAAIGDLGSLDPEAIYERLAVEDIRGAADLLAPVWESTGKADGFVSLEVSPYLARDTETTVAEARRLWARVDRPNLMIKVPATPEGIPAIERLIAEGIHVNATLLFSLEAYEAVARAYVSGLETFVAEGGDPATVASVASFFVSRVDTAVDRALPEGSDLRGKAAVANAKAAYALHGEIFAGEAWEALRGKGARVQRLLWASTGTKNPDYSDVLYVDELIGPDTVNTVPMKTLDAFRDHGNARPTLTEGVDEAKAVLARLEAEGISLGAVTDRLLEEGVRSFSDAFDELLAAVARRRMEAVGSRVGRQEPALPAELREDVEARLEEARVAGVGRRIWAKDATVWTDRGEEKWLGWLDIVADRRAHLDEYRPLIEEVRAEGFTHALLIGMGGSSLFPEVLRMTFGTVDGHPDLHVIDSTDPAQIRRFEAALDLPKTIFVVSSKSGSTLEPNILLDHFLARMKETVGDGAGRHFVAVTDPGSKLEALATAEGFRHVFHGWPTIGGRYSALSSFGLVPAAIMGLDLERLLASADAMAKSCAASVPPAENPGVVLGTLLGAMAKRGRDKMTVIASPALWDLGAWMEQLVAESTGKEGHGIIPVDLEDLGAPDVYGDDRVFVHLRLVGDVPEKQDRAMAALEKAGQPVVRITLENREQIAGEVFRWEVATAVSGAVIGINPFDQPDVEASKVVTRELAAEYENTGSFPAETPFHEEGGIRLFADEANAGTVMGRLEGERNLAEILRVHLDGLKAGDYFALLAYVDMNEEHRAELQAARHAVRDARGVATCLGFGPRFLHSTGQAYKGGPNTGVFLQVTCDEAEELPVPGRKYGFGVVKAAQAQGDLSVLNDRGRRALRVHLGEDVVAGLRKLRAAIEKAAG